ncbi:hypothetical protein ACIGW8_27220 [Streptomyces sioyaensis]|uniref:hypothetical protein n=1 Tax=Streptomyces sioyaensis TaxID=67364 RepID=UPI0037D65415
MLRDGKPTGQQRRFVLTNGTVGEVVANSTSRGGSTVLTSVVAGRGGRCTAHADLSAAERGALTVGPSVVDRPAPGRTASSTSVLRLGGDGTLHREFLGDDKQPRTYSRAEELRGCVCLRCACRPTTGTS